MDFDALYQSLNVNQKKAVDTIEGAVMVVAGPGTGKTQVLGTRVASILQNTDTQAENILCLTFTEAATSELRNRLSTIIGAESYKVNIYTYHGFCNMVIQENKDVFGIQHLDPIADLEVVEVIREMIDELPNASKIKRFVGDVYYDVNPLRNLFGLMKKDNLTPEDIIQKVEELKSAALDSDEYRYKRKTGDRQAGDLNQKKYDDFVNGLDKLCEAASLLDIYKQKLSKRNRYDFNDMLYWVLNAFNTHEELLLKYQEQYQYFLVDEYQDTNGIQNELLYALISYWENPNVFVVGDDDQSIYKFQGANVENIHKFFTQYASHIQLVVLDQNYRSSQHILDVSSHLIQKNTERLVGKVENLHKNITAANPEVATIHPAVHVLEYPNLFQEIVSITTKLKALQAQGVSLSDVSIMYRKHRQSDELIKYLESEGISYNVSKTLDVLQVPLVDQLNRFLTYLVQETIKLDSGQHLLFELLHAHHFQHLSALDIGKISNLIAKNKGKGWREQLHDLMADLTISSESKAELKAFVADIEYWLKELHNRTLQDFVEKFMSKMGFVSRALNSQDATFHIQCLKTYYNFLKEETARNPYLKLPDFLAKIELLKHNNLGLKLNKVIHGANGVNLMTVHGSKGLQFDYVFVIGCTENHWEKEKNNLPYRLNVIYPGEPKEALIEESRRLFYVALTRARKNIQISYAQKDDKDKLLMRSLFVQEILESKVCELEQATAPEEELLHFFDFMLKPQARPNHKLFEQEFVRKEVENFRLSATNLNSYLRCPVSFFYQNIIRVPSSKNDSMTFGSAIHDALDALYKSFKKADHQKEPLATLLDRFGQEMEANKESFTPANYKRRLFYGKEVLTKYYHYYTEDIHRNVQVETEQFFKNCEIDGVPIRGQIDKMVIQKNTVHVVDFKTGQYKYGRKKLNPPVQLEENPDDTDHEKRYGGDYWRQILFYKALIESNASSGLEVISGEIDFIEPADDVFKKHVIYISPEEYDVVRKQIKDTYQRIQNLEFDQGCEKEECMWCSFNKYQQTEAH